MPETDCERKKIWWGPDLGELEPWWGPKRHYIINDIHDYLIKDTVDWREFAGNEASIIHLLKICIFYC